MQASARTTAKNRSTGFRAPGVGPSPRLRDGAGERAAGVAITLHNLHVPGHRFTIYRPSAMDAIARYAELDPDAPAVIDGERRVSWHDYHLARNRLAHALGDLDVAAGEHVVLYAHNSLDVLLAAAAVRALGAIPVPMNHRLTAEEVAYILGDSDAVALFAGDAFLPIVERVRGQAPRLRHVVLLGADRRPWARHVDELLAAGSPAPVAAPPGLGGSMVYTAGTTGKPKGARRRATDPAAMLPRLAALHCIDPHDVHLVAGPLYHSAPGAFALYAHALGQTVVVLRKFDAEDALRVIERHRCTTTFMAPTLLKRLVDLPAAVRGRYDVSSMRSTVVAASTSTRPRSRTCCTGTPPSRTPRCSASPTPSGVSACTRPCSRAPAPP